MSAAEPTKAEAKKLVEEFAAEAAKDLDALGSLHEFEMAGECKDKDGNLTRVFTVDTDKDGVLGMFLRKGQPTKLLPSGEVSTNDDALVSYFEFMSNVDMSSDENLKAVGFSALAKGRELVATFFTLRLASDMNAG